eukprot:PLAT4354.6.p2 GENE.PLAT4354.6~~PLAT4354.6.p2  ORF type:complete len:421 (+),score=204.01 PLAT4354.6:96-1265(+)
MFDRVTTADRIIVVEDDLLYSPDFYEYFLAVSPALDRDPTLWCISAWNDNGFDARVRDANRLLRTHYFPGLGWMLTRKLYKRELEARWPATHWDHWMRQRKQHKGRECVFPEVPRTYHNGVQGTFMDRKTHDKLFAHIKYNTDASVRWQSDAAVASVQQAAYDAALRAELTAAHSVASLEELRGELTADSYAVWYAAKPTRKGAHFKAIAAFFGLWHEFPRGAHSGLHRFYWRGKLMLLVNTGTHADFRSLRPAAAQVFSDSSFAGIAQTLPPGQQLLPRAADKPGVSCDAVCSAAGLKCEQTQFQQVNTCFMLQRHLPCEAGCDNNVGGDQPAYVIASAPDGKLPKTCLINSKPSTFSCTASYPLTRRLCPCVGAKSTAGSGSGSGSR